MKRIVMFLTLISIAVDCRAQPEPGDVFRSYKWRHGGRWQRVRGPEATETRARKHLPNSVNEVIIDELSYDEFEVPLKLIRPGVNTRYTHSKTTHHGIEVQWRGMVLLIKYDKPE